MTDDGKSDWWFIHHGKKFGPHPELVEEFLAETGQQLHIYELLQFLRYAAETGSDIQPDAVQHIADAMIADAEALSKPGASDRSRSVKALRAELRARESELDGLIRSLIDLPPKAAETETAPRDDTKRSLKVRISELTDLLNTLREQLTALETDVQS